MCSDGKALESLSNKTRDALLVALHKEKLAATAAEKKPAIEAKITVPQSDTDRYVHSLMPG